MTEISEITKSLIKTVKICSILHAVTVILLLIFSGASLVTLGISVTSGSDLTTVCHLLISSILVIVMLSILAKILYEPIIGKSPFSSKQPKRFIELGITVFAKFAVDMLTPLFVASEFSQNIAINYAPLPNSGQILDINITLLLFSLIFVSLSVVFKYGTLLQKLSDETV